MEKSRRIFFQILLLVLALVFILTVKYAYESRSAKVGNFGTGENMSNVTITDVFSAFYAGGEA